MSQAILNKIKLRNTKYNNIRTITPSKIGN